MTTVPSKGDLTARESQNVLSARDFFTEIFSSFLFFLLRVIFKFHLFSLLLEIYQKVSKL